MEQVKGEWELFKHSAGPSLPFRTMGAQEVMATLVAKADLATISLISSS